MKSNYFKAMMLAVVFLLLNQLNAQVTLPDERKSVGVSKPVTSSREGVERTREAIPMTGRYEYEVVENDPLQARIYTLDNGLKVYMTVYENTPRIEAYVAVRAGSKHDPAETTGLAHYFEHMMFKGTKRFGTTDFEKESVYINKIDSLFEVYRNLTDNKERRDLYKVIDSLSIIASEYTIPNEYDKLMSIIGASGTNAYTSLEQTVYIENIPSNQLENWARIQADRFANPVLRLFHTELETIYEEKNMTMTNDGMKMYFALLEGLFPNHTYGTQTVIGSQEHLKNPSMKNIREFHAAYYVPNNMAVCLSGDFNPDEAIRIIDRYFGSMKRSEVPPFRFRQAEPSGQPVTKEVFGPDAESILIGFRFNGAGSKDAYILSLIDMILMNSAAGLFDINLLQKQKLLEAYSYNMILEDYTALILAGKPKGGQTLDDVKDLLLSQIQLIKKGEFEDWLLKAIVNDLKLQQIRSFENNSSRASAFVDAFVLGIPWKEYVEKINIIEKITKDDVVRFVNERFTDDYVVVYKRTGKDPDVQKIAKNKITPVKINRDDESDFLLSIRNNKPPDIKPQFLNFREEISISNLGPVEVQYIKNVENETFRLYYVFDMGTQHNKYLDPAVEYLEFIGTSDFSPEEIKKEFYKIGCSYSVFTSNDQIYVSLSGLSENMDAGLKLFEHLLTQCVPDEQAWNNYVDNTIKKRDDAKKNIQYVFSYLVMYGMYGQDNPLTYQLTEKELREIKPQEMTDMIKGLSEYKYKVLYYGNLEQNDLKKLLSTYRKVPETLKDYPPKFEFEQQPTDKNRVFFVNFDTPHTQILMVNRGEKGFKRDDAAVNNLFNEYFGMNMNSIVFQEMREARGLAYAAISMYQAPSEADLYYTGISYIATQFDKVEESINGFYGLLNDMPLSEKSFEVAKESFLQSLRTERTTRADIFFAYQRAQKLGMREDIREVMYRKGLSLTLDDLKLYQQKHLKDKNQTILVLGNEKDVSKKVLKKFGKLKKLKMEEIFGY